MLLAEGVPRGLQHPQAAGPAGERLRAADGGRPESVAGAVEVDDGEGIGVGEEEEGGAVPVEGDVPDGAPDRGVGGEDVGRGGGLDGRGGGGGVGGVGKAEEKAVEAKGAGVP